MHTPHQYDQHLPDQGSGDGFTFINYPPQRLHHLLDQSLYPVAAFDQPAFTLIQQPRQLIGQCHHTHRLPLQPERQSTQCFFQDKNQGRIEPLTNIRAQESP